MAETLVRVFSNGELTVAEKDRLEELEAVIEKNFQAFYVVGLSLAEIQMKRLYTQTHETFEEYVRDRFEIARRTAYQYIEAANAMDNVRNCAQIEILPANEAQVRPLTRLEPEKQPEAWEAAVKTAPDGKITAKHVSNVVRDLIGEQIRKKTEKAKEQIEKDDLVTPEFKTAFWSLVQVIRVVPSQTLSNKSREAMLVYIRRLEQLLSE